MNQYKNQFSEAKDLNANDFTWRDRQAIGALSGDSEVRLFEPDEGKIQHVVYIGATNSTIVKSIKNSFQSEHYLEVSKWVYEYSMENVHG